MKKYYLIFLICSGFILSACTSKNDASPDESGLFIKILGGNQDDTVNDFFISDNGEIVGTGTTQSFRINNDFTNILLFKTDKLGNKIFLKGLGGAEGSSIIPTNDGGYAILGNTSNFITLPSYHLLKINAQGTIELDRTYSPILSSGKSTKAVSVAIGQDNNYLLMGNVEVNSKNTIYFMKVSSIGDVLSDKYYTYANSSNTIAKGKMLANGDGVIVGTITENGDSKIRITLINSDLGPKWDFNYKSDIALSTTSASDIQIANAGFIVAGTSIVNKKNVGFLLKTNSNGLLTWKKDINIGAGLSINSVYPTQDGGYILTGNVLLTDREIPHTHIWVGKVDATGNLEWNKDFGNRKDDKGVCVRVTKEGNYVVMGNIDFGTSETLVLINLDKNGNLIR